MTDEAQAVAALANLGGKVVDAVSGMGHYAAEVFGTVPHDAVGLVIGDRLRQRRTKNAIRYEAEVAELLARVDPDRISPPSPSVLIPWMTSAADEERDELRKLWAALLANAAIDGGRKVRSEFFETLRQMEPIDAAVLRRVARGPLAQPGESPAVMLAREVIASTSNADDFEVSFAALEALRCVRLVAGIWYPTPYGMGLLRALEVA